MYFCGFNGFGQFGKAHASRVLEVTNFEVEYPFGDFLIRPAWSCNVIAVGNEIFISGFVHNDGKAVEKLTFPDKIADICATDKYCLVLLESGQFFKLTRNDLKIQEIRFVECEAAPSRKRKIFEGTTVKFDKSDPAKIKFIACGSNLAVAINNRNDVYNIPTKTFQFPAHEKIVSLQCGFEHAMALNSNGDVYTWGNGLRGQLGVDEMRVQETPTLIEALSGIKILSIGAGGWHSAAVSSFGDVYAWGFNCNGQIGIRVFKVNGVKNPSVYPLPQLIDLPQCCKSDQTDNSSCNAVAVNCGARHTIVKTACGSIFAVGWNSYGQLGIANAGNVVDEFQKVCDMPEGDVRIICGPWCTIFKINKV